MSRNVTGQVSAPGDGVGVVIGLAVIAGLCYLLYLFLLVPGFAIAAEIYTGITAVPSTFTALHWTSLLTNLLIGAFVGLIVGLIRLRLRSKILEKLIGIVVSDKTLTATQAGVVCVFIHVLIGAISGVVVSLIGMASPLAVRSPSLFTEKALPAMALLIGAGFFNGGGAPPDLWSLVPIVIVILVLVIVGTILLSLGATSTLTIIGNVLLSSATKSFGRALGSSIVFAISRLLSSRNEQLAVIWLFERDKTDALNNPAKQPSPPQLREKHWFAASLASGLRTGFVVGVVNSLVTLSILFLVRGQVIHTLGPPPDLAEITAFGSEGNIELSPRGKILIVGSSQVTCSDLFAEKPLWTSGNIDFAITAFHPSAGYFISCNGVQCYQVRETDGSRSYLRNDVSEGKVFFTHDGTPMVLKESAGHIALSDFRTGATVRTFAPPVSEMLYSYVLGAGADVIAVVHEKYVVIYEISTGRVLRTLMPDEYSVIRLAINPGGTLLATLKSEERDRIELWNLTTGKPFLSKLQHKGVVTDFQFSPDGKWLASTAFDGSVNLWDTRTGRGLKRVTGLSFSENHLIFSPDSKFLASMEGERFKLWAIR